MINKRESHKRNKIWSCAISLAVLGASMMTGCASRTYEPIETPAVEIEGAGLEKTEAGTETQESLQISELETVLTTETAPSFKEVSETVYVTADNVNLRKNYGPTGEVIAKLNKGTALKRTASSDTWSKVVYQDQDAYISSQYVSATAAETAAPTTAQAVSADAVKAGTTQVALDSSWKYANFSKINSGTATLYTAQGNRKGITVCVNAGHGTSGGQSVKTQCHPDGTAKVTGGTTGAGATTAVAVSSGMTFSDGTAEAKVTLAEARLLRDKLLANGYDVLMIRDGDDVQLDNVARTVMANNKANCHIAIHWDSTTSNKGAFYMSVPSNSSYRSMEPVASTWQKHNALGESLVAGLKANGTKIFSGGSMEMDLTQTSYSTVPSVDIELGDKSSDHSQAALDALATGLANGVDQYFGQ